MRLDSFTGTALLALAPTCLAETLPPSRILHVDIPCQLFNGQYPGPVISANWGDTVSVTLKNSLQNNGTGIHWHGIRQLNTCPQDGVGGITECPLAPGDSKTYTFHATQHGTTWYHSHFSSQYGTGAFGPIVINGLASANYDYDLGSYVIIDYYYESGWVVQDQAHANLQAASPPPPADTILINGTNKDANGNGAYNQVLGLEKGKKYRLRLINTSSDNNIRVSLDNHPFTVITSDLVPIKPYTATSTAGNYWFRANIVTACGSSNNGAGLSVFSYQGAASGDPTSTGYTLPTDCNDETNLIPWVSNTVNATASLNEVGSLDINIALPGTSTNGGNMVVWSVNLTAIDVAWDMPTMQYVKDGNTSYPTACNMIEIPYEGTWSYWIIQEPAGSIVPIPHPIHLHGHDFYVLGTGDGILDINSSPSTLTYTNPPTRHSAPARRRLARHRLPGR
ncbi:multicopper oxidase [Trematosphaeria pertusa]|uniref:laccase n=1 Tax=Trematosphaeria pertusa TaxID=390896 RepID=A0A6A6ICA9_9PLEO|nr:multicopper oxidase [Trematosphaeria pertusa]KAF2248021.1 multicopper oxidase [Trematosphaeria pertusa]